MAPEFRRLDRVSLRAKCNDGSPGTFYWSSSQNGVWHIHLQGGGSCYDEDTCFSPNHDAAYMTSTLAPKEKIWMRGIFSPDSPSLAMAHAGHAFLKYCSSDSWLGNSSRVWRGRPFFFHGAVILVEAVHALLDRGMRHAKLLLFSGCSAGGRGAIYSMDGVCKLVRAHSPGVRCLGVGDSAWWMESVYLHGQELQSLLRQTAAKHHVWGGSWISQPLWRCRQAQQLQHGARPAGLPLSEVSPNISHFDRCMFGPTLAEHLTTPTLLATSLNDWFQFDHLSRSLHTLTFGGQEGGPVSQIDLQAMEALRNEFRRTLDQWANGVPQAPLRLVFASGCFGHCITEGPLYNSIRLREGPGKGLALSDVVASFVDGHYVRHEKWIEECHCATLNCSEGCAPRGLWQAALTTTFKFIMLPLAVLCGLAWFRRKRSEHDASPARNGGQ